MLLPSFSAEVGERGPSLLQPAVAGTEVPTSGERLVCRALLWDGEETYFFMLMFINARDFHDKTHFFFYHLFCFRPGNDILLRKPFVSALVTQNVLNLRELPVFSIGVEENSRTNWKVAFSLGGGVSRILIYRPLISEA